MAVYHCQIKLIKRSAGRSVTAAAAYRSGTRIKDKRTGEVHNYTRRQGIDYTAILIPEQAPTWMLQRDVLWNAVEIAERRKNSQLARYVEVALPREFNLEQQIALITGFAQQQFVDQGMVADITIHNTGTENPCAHILLTMRDITKAGFGQKNRQWNNRKLVVQWREGWAIAVNQMLEAEGFSQRVDHRSLKDRGIDRLPGCHLGAAAAAMERRGQLSERGNLNRSVAQENRKLEQIHARINTLDQQLTELEQQRKVSS